MFSKYDLQAFERALTATIDRMNKSKFVGPQDPHCLKVKELRSRVAAELAK